MRSCSKCGRNRADKFYVSSRGRVCKDCRKGRSRRAAKNKRLKDTYDISMADYDALWAHQGGVCAICGGKRKVLDVDHDHHIERLHGSRLSVRGLLCRSCNKILAYARDDSDRLRGAADYLEDPPAGRVLDREERE